ncbi:hypothetical protein Fcan01_04893 [Folsomia candida]|uniref:Uncharacterized protein n=2 Tax=Folsomia candida TaxID=158441 RepID=A0A226ETT5_FOLCA|nr:hypothetical protein Fcan01_04893 [Folsomia candida]
MIKMQVFHLVPFIFFACFGLFNSVDAQQSPEFYNYTITKTWNNQTSPENAMISLSFSLERDPEGHRSLKIHVQAPFFNDPVGPTNATDEPFYGLWDFEVVEAFFLGDNDEYLEIELAPSSHYVLLYLNGYRNDTEMYLPLRHFTAKIDNSTTPPIWTGEAFIPANYFPCNVTKFNAYAIHKSDPNRRYMSLFPVAEETPNPDFHYLPAFESAPFLSQIVNPLCQTYQHNVKTTWDGKPSPDMAEIFISFFLQEETLEQNRSVLMEINAPFFEDPAAPDAGTQEPFPGLW